MGPALPSLCRFLQRRADSRDARHGLVVVGFDQVKKLCVRAADGWKPAEGSVVRFGD